MTESTTLAAEGATESAVRAKVKLILHGVLATEAAAVNTLLMGLIPTWADSLISKVMSIPALTQLEQTYLDKGADELVDLVFFGGDALVQLIYKHVPEVKAIVQAANAAQTQQVAQQGALKESVAMIRTMTSITAMGKQDEAMEILRKTFSVA